MPVETPAAKLAPPVLDRVAAEGRSVLLEPEVYALLATAGIEAPQHRVVIHPDEVDASLCAALSTERVVVKVVSPDILHKSDVGGVQFCANDVPAIAGAVRQVLASARRLKPEASIQGALIAEAVAFENGLGREVLAGFRHDPAFGPVVIMGVGGLDTEYLQEALRPERAKLVVEARGLNPRKARLVLEGTVVHRALTGRLRSTRGAGFSEDELVRLLVGLGDLARRFASLTPEGGLGLAELEVNPFVVAGGRLLALDGLARLHRPVPLPPARPIASLKYLLTPGSAVVIGASAETSNVGRVILRNLIQGGSPRPDRIWAIHPRAQTIDGCRAFASLAELPEVADMAVVAVAADKGGDQVVLDLITTQKARTVTLISGGFGETRAGRGAEERMRQAIESAHRAPGGGVLVNGGNCLGIISVPGGYNTFFIPPHKLPFHDAPGQNVASISQSGAYLVTQISNLDRAIRPRYAISFGNQLDVTASDYLDYLAGDPGVQVFAVYLEGFRPGDGARFLEVAERIVSGGRTVLLYKAGRTPEGGAAAASHTAASVGDYEVCRQLVRSAGVIDCFTLNMFEDYLMTFSFLADRKAAGRRVAVLSNAGFECTAAADKLYGLELANFDARTRERLRWLLPTGIVDVHNPVDATPVTPTETYVGCVEALVDDPGVDALVVAGVPATPYLEDLARGEGHAEDISRETSLPSRLIRIFRATRKPMVFSVDSGALYEGCVQMMKRAGLPCFRKVDRATRALAAFVGSSR